ncbi:11358_t:CDS:2 [Funneliformis mosseae]|uniref:11358_t:CDS:1 n=1 Tax=Funneliformis mosseae TaxID=27381 RepID=A0A9N8W868_FUNMO|nr:11358_t:CDS:2 [Funneliformis mosseae]
MEDVSYDNISEYINTESVTSVIKEELKDFDKQMQDYQLSYKLLLNTEEEEFFDNYDLLEKESSDFKDFNRKYGPFFPNFTSSMLFIWITKHIISISAYKDLFKILTHLEYRKEDLIANIRQICK